MSTLKRLFRKVWDAYPRKPLLYICSHNGVTGVVRAEDFDDEVRRMRRSLKRGWPTRGVSNVPWPVRPQVYPVFLFSDKNPRKRSFRVGTLDEMWEAFDLCGCVVEERSFELPPLNAPGHTPFGYFGMMVEIGRENARHRVWSLKQARTYFRGGAIYTYNL